MKHQLHLAAIALLVATPPATLAAGGTESGSSAGKATTSQAETPPMFKELDRNKDGQISKREARRSADLNTRFDTLDTDKNKQISLAEWMADEKAQQGGAAGVSGESREKPSSTMEQSRPGQSGERTPTY